MGTWVSATVDGYLREDVRLDRDGRRAVVQQLSALACAGLRMDSLYVRFADFMPPMDERDDGLPRAHERQRSSGAGNEAYHDEIHSRLRQELTDLGWRLDLQLAATYGEKLGLVEPHRDGVRFPHSILQAYLGSRYLGFALRDEEYVRSALEESGREFLLALVMHTRGLLGL